MSDTLAETARIKHQRVRAYIEGLAPLLHKHCGGEIVELSESGLDPADNWTYYVCQRCGADHISEQEIEQ